jgi:3-phenylpropionate/trans-cinnamate dioxygenase ferredoxin subunit
MSRAQFPVEFPVTVDVSDFAPGTTRVVAAGDEEILLCNVDGEIHAVANRCTHAEVALTNAALIDGKIECPVHGARFDAKTGAVLSEPAERGLRCYAVTRRGPTIEIAPR